MALKRTRIVDLEELLLRLGLNRGDVVMIHSATFTLGLVEHGLDGIYQAIRRILGPDGTLIVPTFSYSFRRGETFNVMKTPCPKALGAFSEYVRTLAGAVRSADPLFSMAAVGPEAENLMRRQSYFCFGRGSIYENLFSRDILIVGIGITYDTGISAFMHLERLAEVDYRRELTLHGTTVGVNGVAYADVAVHFERNTEKYPNGKRNRIPLGLELEREGISKMEEFGSGRHFAMRALSLEKYVLERLYKDPWLMFNRGI